MPKEHNCFSVTDHREINLFLNEDSIVIVLRKLSKLREARETTQQIRKYHMNRIRSSTETESILKEKKHQREILELIKLIK